MKKYLFLLFLLIPNFVFASDMSNPILGGTNYYPVDIDSFGYGSYFKAVDFTATDNTVDGFQFKRITPNLSYQNNGTNLYYMTDWEPSISTTTICEDTGCNATFSFRAQNGIECNGNNSCGLYNDYSSFNIPYTDLYEYININDYPILSSYLSRILNYSVIYKDINGTILSTTCSLDSSIDLSKLLISYDGRYLNYVYRPNYPNSNTPSYNSLPFVCSINNNKLYDLISIRNNGTYLQPTNLIYSYNLRISSNIAINYNTDPTGVLPPFPTDEDLILQEPSEYLDNIEVFLKVENILNGWGNTIFDDFELSNHQGIRSIITAPLSAIQEMSNNTCTPISFTLYNKNISFPCGSIFWNRSGASALKDFINLTLGGYLCFCIVRKLFYRIQEFEDPNSGKVEVDKL